MKILKNNPIWDFLLQIKFFSFSTQVIIIFKIYAINTRWMKYFRINLFIQFVIPKRKTFLYHCLYHNFLLFVSFCWNTFSWRNPGFNSWVDFGQLFLIFSPTTPSLPDVLVLSQLSHQNSFNHQRKCLNISPQQKNPPSIPWEWCLFCFYCCS